MGLAPGYLVSQHVKLVRMLKRGGMGSVWIADHLALETQVAVKFMSGAAADDEAMVARFAREATSAAKIKSPHVVQVHDHGVTPEGEPFIVMELLEGEDLSTRMKQRGLLSIDEVATILLQTSRVLGKAHEMGIIHRDIKPSNIFLVDNHGEIFVKVLDFGVAKMGREGSELTTTGAMVGTVVYMSPEQLLSARKVDHRADLWSLAVVAYRALTGQLPFKDDEGLGALCKALEHGIFFPPSAFVPSISPELDAWFDRAFQRKPDDRFANAREFVEEFFTAVGKSSAPASAPSVALRAAHEAAVAEALTAAEPGVTRASKADPRRLDAPMPKPSNEDTLSAAGQAPSSAPTPGTLAGTASGPYPAMRPRSKLRGAIYALGSVALIAGLGLAGAAYLGKLGRLRLGPLRAPAAPITGEPMAVSAAPPVTAPVIVQSAPSPPPPTLPAGAVVPVSSAVASAAPKASASATPPVSSAKGSGSGKPGDKRPPRPEKDYGF